MKVLFYYLIMNKVCFCCLFILVIQGGLCQSYTQKITSFYEDNGLESTGGGTFNFTTNYSPSKSTWQLDWDESHVFQSLMSYTDDSNTNQSFELRFGKGGQIYSLKMGGVEDNNPNNNGNLNFGEILPPQYRGSVSEQGGGLADQPPSNPVKSHHGNWAAWNDEVWQMVGSDQIDFESNGDPNKTQNIHQAGPYMNNYAHRDSDHNEAPFYSPMVQSYYNATEQSFSAIYWGQSEDPEYVVDSSNFVLNDGSEHPDQVILKEVTDPFRPSVLFFQRYKNIGDGILQVDFLIYNYHRTRGIDYWNVPWAGIRNSSLPYAFISNSATNLNSYESVDLLEWTEGIAKRVTGNNSESSGWFVFSAHASGNGPSLAFVTANQTTNPPNAYSDLRYGTALGTNNIRDCSIFSRRSIGGAINPNTNLKTWGLVAGQSIRGRYYVVLDSSISNIISQINNRNLIASSSVEMVTIPENQANEVYYTFSANGSGGFVPNEVSEQDAQLTLNAKPFNGSYPVFLISTLSETILSSNPYYFSLKPHDRQVKSIELLGFYNQEQQLTLSTNVLDSFNKIKIFPNPTKSSIHIEGIDIKQISVFNSLGQKIIQKEFKSEKENCTFDTSSLAKGNYLLQVNTHLFRFLKN